MACPLGMITASTIAPKEQFESGNSSDPALHLVPGTDLGAFASI